MADQPEVGAGDVSITFLDGQTILLKCSQQACEGICRLHRDTDLTIRHVVNGDFDTLVAVVLLGLNNPAGQKAKLVSKLLYADGLYTHGTEIVKFIANVRNGGRPYIEPTAEEEAESQSPPEQAA